MLSWDITVFSRYYLHAIIRMQLNTKIICTYVREDWLNDITDWTGQLVNDEVETDRW